MKAVSYATTPLSAPTRRQLEAQRTAAVRQLHSLSDERVVFEEHYTRRREELLLEIKLIDDRVAGMMRERSEQT